MSTLKTLARMVSDLGTAATKNVGTAAGTVAAGDDSRITGAVPNTRSVSVSGGILSGGGDLSADRTITAPESTQAEAEAGTNASTVMTPRRVAQAIAALAPSSGGTVTSVSAGSGITITGTTTINPTVAINTNNAEGVGSLSWAYASSGGISIGGTISGSSLSRVMGSGTGGGTWEATSGSLSGTWRALTGTTTGTGIALFIRTA
jgi:hypothetical protein